MLYKYILSILHGDGELFAFSTQAAALSHPRLMRSNSFADVGGLLWGTLDCLSPQEAPRKEAGGWVSAGKLGREFFLFLSFLLKQSNKWLQLCFQRRKGALHSFSLCPLVMAKYSDGPLEWRQYLMKARSRSF